jgi:hypothetical protein
LRRLAVATEAEPALRMFQPLSLGYSIVLLVEADKRQPAGAAILPAIIFS